MHEWALAEGIISKADRIAIENNLEITDIVIQIGELQQIDDEILQFALEQLRTDNMKKARFTLETIKAKLKCRACGEEWRLDLSSLDEESSEAVHFVPEMAHVYIKCPRCGSPDFEVLEGRGVWLASVRGVRKDG
ncbi:hydrogenase nickel incorporation protein HypA [Candidatus Bathyarchaeota archaeon]|nr:hydrogenase nickel incorporation protein HypA [Candidatus Bathyarchaeota archaeon]